MRKYVSLIPTSAHTGEGIPDLLTLIIDLTQKLLVERLRFRPDDVECTVLEVKRLEGLGMTVDVILAQGALREGDTVVMCSFDGPVVTQIKALLMPPPLRELRVKVKFLCLFCFVLRVCGLCMIGYRRTMRSTRKSLRLRESKCSVVTLKVLWRALSSMSVAQSKHKSCVHLCECDTDIQCTCSDLDEIERLKKMVVRQLEASLAALETQDRGVYVMASTLGALEALLEYLRTSKVPVSHPKCK